MHDAIIEFSDDKTIDEAVWRNFAAGLYYFPGEFDSPETYKQLQATLARADNERGTSGNRIFYLSTAPSVFGLIAKQLGEAGMAHPAEADRWARIIVEKPFGHDLASAKMLNAELEKFFQEGQIYRIDHYLGKETVQNILVLRFANGIFEPIWNRRYVDSVQITVAESLGIEDRGRFYEETGVVRDVIQNHALQLLSLVAMEPPLTFDARDFRDEKIRVVEAVHPICKEDVPIAAVRGQYGPGFEAGVNVRGYREEPNVAPDSTVPTYAAFKFMVDNWRWAGVPFYVRSGKRMPKRVTEIAMQFKEVPHLPFRKSQVEMIAGNVLSLRIQPDEGITLKFGAKVPGPVMRIRSVAMDFDYGATFGTEDASPYERLILDCMKGDQTLFDRDDGVEAAWSLIDPILQVWQEQPPVKFPNYAAGTWGPAEADELLARDGKSWRLL